MRDQAVAAREVDDSSPCTVAADPRLPPSAHAIAEALATAWPRLAGRVSLESRRIEDVAIGPDDVVLSAHACGGLTDQVLDRAIEAHARVAVLPCCHDAERNDTGGLDGWLDAPLAIDVTRAARLRAHGYTVRTQTIPESITPKNRLLIGEVAQIRIVGAQVETPAPTIR